MTTITGTLLDASGAGVSGVPVTARLIAAATTQTAGGEIIRKASTTSALNTGAWSLVLTPISALAHPTGAYYLVEADGRRWPITVPDTGTHELRTVLVDVPSDREQVGLTQTSADARYEQLVRKGIALGYAGLDVDGKVPAAQLPVGSGGSINPSGTVATETAFGQASAAGASATYSRGDHTHGTPAAPTPAGIGAATAVHTHAGADITSGTVAVGRLPVGTGAAQVAAGDHTHPAEAGGPIFDLSGYGFVAATGDPIDFMLSSSYTSSQPFFVRTWIPAGKAITGLWIAVRSAGVYDGGSTPNQLGIYTDAGVLVDTTANDPTLWTAVGWRGGNLAGGPIAAQGAGRFVYLAALARGMTTPPNVSFATGAGDWAAFQTGPGQTKRRCFLQASTALPATIDPASGGSATGFVPLFGVS